MTEINHVRDKELYNISKNEELLPWLNLKMKNGYHLYASNADLQGLIDNIVYWYEMKYPERELELYEGIRNFAFVNIESLTSVMTLKQLMYRLPHKQLCLMKCDYRASSSCWDYTYDEKGEITGSQIIILMDINKKWITRLNTSSWYEMPNFSLYADASSGKVTGDFDLKKYIGTDNITLDELLALFKQKHSNNLDFTKLEECIYDHNCDIELRRRILQLAALKLLYSPRTNRVYGYERAKRFINEFNTELGLNLSTEEIDKAFNASEPINIVQSDKIKKFPNP